MSSLRNIKEAQKSLQRQQELVAELNALVKDIERSETTIIELKNELVAVNAKYPTPRDTRQDIAYLTDLLRCANKKLIWEKQLSSLQKRTPALLQTMSSLLDDPQNAPSEQVRAQILSALEAIRTAMGRLQGAKLD